MNKQDLLARAEQITLEMENAIKKHTALVSHLNECNFWLSNFEKLEAENAAILAEQEAVINAENEAAEKKTAEAKLQEEEGAAVMDTASE